MAPKLNSSSKGTPFARKTNALGFAKRQSRKAEAATRTGSDVYEYWSGKNRRAAVKLSLDKDETIGLGIDENAKGEFDLDALRARIMDTGDDGDAAIHSEDDEEIESDDAFEETDEDRFAGFSFTKKPLSKKPKQQPRTTATVRFADVDLNEDDDDGDTTSVRKSDQDEDDEEVDGDSDEFLDVLDVLDGRGEPEFREDEEKESSDEEAGVDEDEEEEEGSEASDEEMVDVFAPSDAELQPDGEALDSLGAFVSQLDNNKKRKAEGGSDTVVEGIQPSTRKRRMLKERTEAGVEGEFGVHAASGAKLQLNDLLTPLVSTSSSLEALKKSTKPLVKGDALSAPLPQRAQDRLDREAAYEQTKEEVDKWKATMKRIKEADHLSFPLQVPQKVNPSNSGLTAKFIPSNPLESAVDKLLKAAQMREENDIAKTEELKMNHLSVEEVADRRSELRKMRDLMFRAETKAKRVAKIKSKTYRKIQRKSRDRVKGLIKEAEGDDNEDGGEEQMKREVERARERATLRHKNTGKWAKAMKGRGELELDQRQEIEEMLEKGERLRAKIQGRGDSESDEDGDGEDGGVDDIQTSAFEELERVEQDDDVLPRQADKGVFAMKFMQDAMAREAQKVTAAVGDFRDEIARMVNGSDGTPDDEDTAGLGGVHVQRIGGRAVYRPGQVMVSPWPIAPSESSSTLKSSEPALQSPAVASQTTTRSSPPVHPADLVTEFSPPTRRADNEPNPWLVPSGPSTTQSRRRNEVLVGKDSIAAVKSKNLMKKRLLKGDEERQNTRDDAVIGISMDAVLKLPEDMSTQKTTAKSAKAKGKEKAQQNGHQVDAAFEDSDENSEVEAQEQRAKVKGKPKGVKAFEQRDLVALAFAGDNVVQDFAKLKQREISADAPREEDHTLPGWGSWGGAGTKRNPHARRFIKKIAGIDPKSRADHGKPHLIISEKKDKKAAKYLTSDLPYPFTSKAQFEKSMEIPIGTEWNTRVGFQRQTLPRVVKKMGTVIDPLEKVL